MAFIQSFIDKIRTAKEGKEVRGSLADGIDAINKETEATTNRQVNLDATFKQLIINAGESNAEIVAARHDNSNGQTYDTLPERLDATTTQLATKAEQEKVDLSWVYVNNQTSLVNALAYSKRVKLISDITITAPITLLEGTHIHFNGYIIHSNHEGKAINDVTGCYFYHLSVYSNFGVEGDYMPNNICVVATDSVFYNPVIKSFGTDALVLNGGCTVDLLETDDIRDNPIVLYGENNFVNCVNCGTCGGDFILIKGNKNMVLKGKCNIAGYRENTTNFTAGSGIVIGADGTVADDNYVGDIEINYWGANLFNIDGNRNYINSIKAISSLYDDTYPVANSTNLVRAGLIAKNYNKVGIITIETTPRVIGIAGSNNTVEIMDIGTVTKQGMLSIESSSYESNRIGKLIIEKILTGGDSFRIYGNKTKFDEILVDSISGGGTDHFKCYGDQVRIGTLKIFGDETTTTGNFGILSSQNAEIDSLTVWGYNGYTLNVIKKCFLAKLNLRNNTTSYDNILIINVTDGSKFAINGSSISDRTGGARRTKIKGNANVIFTNNLAADPVNEGTGQLIVSNNI